jgi:hypothetical protein
MRELFQRFRERKLKIEPVKYEFLRAEVQFLGHVASDEGLRPDPRKKAVRNFSEPKTLKQLKGFLGFSSYYRRFIHNYSKVAKSLYELLKKDAVYDWKEPQQNAFRTQLRLLSYSIQILREHSLLPTTLQAVPPVVF